MSEPPSDDTDRIENEQAEDTPIEPERLRGRPSRSERIDHRSAVGTTQPAWTYKVIGELEAATGTGVWGNNTAGTGACYGVEGTTASSDESAAGVRGSAPNGWADGVVGEASFQGYGVVGSYDGTASRAGVRGVTSSPDFNSRGVEGIATTGDADGVLGRAADGGNGVYGRATDADATGVRAWNTASSGTGYGLYALSNSAAGKAIYAAGDVETTGEITAGHTVTVAGFLGVRETDPATAFHLVFDNVGENDDPTDHLAIIESSDDDLQNQLLALKTGYTGDPGNSNNFLTFFNGDDVAYGSIEGNGGGGVTLDTSSADYAEYLPRLDRLLGIEPGDVVGIVGGGVTKRTADAEQVMVVSGRPLVAGNSPGQESADRAGHETVAFTGQVPVKVVGGTDAGDLLVTSGEGDGTARAVPPGEWTPGRRQIVGRALEGASGEDVTRISAAVGVDDPGVVGPAIDRNGDRIDALEREIERLRERIDEKDRRIAAQRARIDELGARLAALESRVEGRQRAAPADD